jgi:hypothetical protein
MIRLIAGKYGPKLLGPGTVLTLEKVDEQRLVDRKVAVFIDASEKDNKVVTDNVKPIKKTAAEIKKLKSKKELIKYAESIGLHSLEETLSKEALIDDIINYQEENFGEEQ